MANDASTGPRADAEQPTPRKPVAQIVGRLPEAAALAAIAVGAAVLVGWAARVEALLSLLPGYAAMKPITALCFLLCGFALASLCTPPLFRPLSPALAPRLVLGLGVAVSAIGAVTLIEYAAGLDLGFEGALFVGRPTPLDPAPGRMSWATAASFALLGGALVLWRSNRRVAIALVVLMGGITFVAFLGYLYGVAALFHLGGFSAIAIHTVGTFLALFLGLLALDPAHGPLAVALSDSAGGLTVRRLLPAALLVPLVVGYLRLEGEKAGLYSTAFGTALFATALATVFAALVLSTGRAIDRLDAARHEADAARRRSEEWFSKAFHASPVAMTITDAKTGLFLDLNEAAEALLGYGRAEAVGKDSVDLGILGEEARKRLIDRYERQGRAHDEEVQIITKSGAARTALVSGEFLDYGGRRALLAAMVNITERKKAEEAVRESQESLAQAQRIAHVGSWDWDLVRDEARWSDEMFRIFGVPRAEPAGDLAKAMALIHETDRDRVASAVREAIDGTRPYDIDYSVVRPGGEVRHLHAQGEVFREADGRPVRMIGFAQDVTERNQAEDVILKSREELGTKAAELARSNAELEQFAYVASHDLQEPLRMVASYVQLLEKRYRGRLDADADEFIRFASEGATRMQALINDLLTYSRVGTRGREFAATSSEEALRKAIENLQFRIEESSASVTHTGLPTIVADGAQITQLFQNLVQNAIKYRSAEPPRIAVSARRTEGAWEFAVKDNGIGIDPKHFDRIFIIFQRLQARDETSGTGIGLALCKKIVERHGGRIWVESQPGAGSTFKFTIPEKLARVGIQT